MDDILKAYGRRSKLDEFIDVIDFDPELGFNPYSWITRRAEARDRKEELEQIKQRQEMCAAIDKMLLKDLDFRIQKAYNEVVTEQMLKGQAFGL